LTFAVQRSCEFEHLATTSQPSFVCLLLLKAHKVSPARAPSVSMTVSKKPLRSSAEQALASAAHMPTKDILTASSVNNLFSRVPSLSATGTFRVWTRMSPVGGSIIPGSDPRPSASADTAAGRGVSTRTDTAGGWGLSTGAAKAGGGGILHRGPPPPFRGAFAWVGNTRPRRCGHTKTGRHINNSK